MRRSLTSALAVWACQGATNRSRRLFLYLCVSILLLAVVPAWGSPGRMLLVNGKLHRIVRGNDNNIYYAMGHADGDWSFDVEVSAVAKVSWPDKTLSLNANGWPCRTWIPTYGTANNASETFAAEGLAVFNNKIFVAFTADASCTDHTAGMAAYVAEYDLRSTSDFPYGQWTGLYSLGKGSARTDTAAKGWGSGAAITVFNNQLYVITNKGVWTSGEGDNWTAHSFPFATNNPQDEPLDAVTINAPDGPRILIVYGHIDGQHYYYDHLDALDWNPDPTWPGTSYMYPNFGAPSGSVRARVSLTVGTKAGGDAGDDENLAAGALAPAVQLFAQTGEEFTTSNHNPARNAEYVYTAVAGAPGGAWGTWRWDGTRIKYFDHKNPSLMVYPWSDYRCYQGYPAGQAARQLIVLLGGYNWWTTKTPFVYVSDFLVPRNSDLSPSCTTTDGKPAPPPLGVENTTANIKKNYWNLVGVILGSPPFSDQGESRKASPDGALLANLSGVGFDQTTSSTTQTTTETENTASVSVGRRITAGLFDKIHLSKSFDASFKHTSEKESGTSSSETIQIKDEFGTASETVDTLGAYGWGLFTAPHVYVQDWTVYAYNYDYVHGTGHALNLDLQTISTKDTPDYVVEKFDLRNPASSDSIFDGMVSFNYTDIYDNPYLLVRGVTPGETLAYWLMPKNRDTGEVFNWQNDDRWETRAGEGGTTGAGYVCKDTLTHCITQVLSSSASKRTISYALAGDTMTGRGHTNEVGVSLGHTLGLDLALGGFSVGAEGDITVGYDGKFGWNTKTTTGLGTTVSASQMTPGCMDPSCFQSVTVRTYWLHPVSALEGSKGGPPWLPTAYKSQLPWCLTWKVVKACLEGQACDSLPGAATALSPLNASGGISGTGLPPVNAFGRIVSGNGGGDGGNAYSHYFIQGGQMAWGDGEGGQQRIPMTADAFNPSKGVSIEVSGLSWSSSGSGSWKRHGDTWRFQTDPSSKPRVTMTLDFGSATYDLQIQNVDFGGRVPAGVRNTGLSLVVNQQYKFYTVLHNDIDVTWHMSRPPDDNLKIHVTSFQGRYNSATQSGNMSIAGTLPAELPEFGDLKLMVNDHPYVARLITLDGFEQAFETGGVVKYAREGVIVVVDFGKKTWSATFKNQAFHSLLSPQFGRVRAQILVGGVPYSGNEISAEEDHPIGDYSVNLTLVR